MQRTGSFLMKRGYNVNSYTRDVRSDNIFANYGTICWSINYIGSYYNDSVGASAVGVNGMYFLYSVPGFGTAPRIMVNETGIIKNV